MRTYLLALAVVTALAAISSAADEECVQRKLRGLALHWPNPRDCYSFYRCTNKDVKREIACPAGRQYNRRTGKCAPVGRKVCRLSLLAPLQEADNPCSGEISGTYLADPKSCRSFNICNANLAYPQTCNPGSYFDSAKSACVPDTDTTCWENLCLSKANGVYVANENDCYGFYVCADKTAVKQACPSGSYFNKDSLNCVPGVCPSDVVVTTPCPEVTTTTKPAVVTTPCAGQTTTTKVVETTTSCSEKTTTPTVVETTTSCSEKTTTPKVVETTTSCSEKTTTPKVVETTTSCSEKTTTPKVVETTTSCSEKTTTPKVVETTTSSSEKTTTPNVVETTTPKVVETTTSCSEKTTTPKVVETTTPKVVETTTSCSEKTTTPKVVETTTTPKVVETTTPKVVETTTSCSEKTTTPKVVETTTSCSEKTTTPKVVETTTPKVVETTTSCSEKTTTPQVVETTTPKVVETTTSCSEKTTTPKVVETTTPKVVETTTSCSEKTTTPKVVETTTPKVVETTTSCSEKTTTPKVVETTTPKVVETTTPKVVETTTSCSEKTTTPKVVETTTPKAVETTTSCSEKTTTPKVVETTTPKVVETTTPKAVETTTTCSEKTTTPKVVETTTPKVVETTTSCSEKTTTPKVVETTTPKVVETTTSCSEKTTTPKVVETTTPKAVETTTSCSEMTTTPKVVETTTPKVVETTTSCSEKTTTPQVVETTTPKVVETTTPKVVETTTSCSEKTTTPKVVETTTPKVVETTTSCSEKTTTPKVVETTTPKVVETTTSCSEKTTTPKVVETTTPKVVETTTPKVVETTTSCSEKTTTPKVVETTTPKVVETTTSCSEKTTTPKVVETTTPKVVETTTPKVVETTTPCIQGDCSANNCDQTSCLNAENHIAFPAKNDKTQYCVCMNKQAICRVCPEGSEFDSQINVCKPIVVTTTPCPTTTLATTTASVVVTTTPCLQGDCSANNCDQTSCLNAENHIAFPAKNDKTQYCVCMNKQAICRVCPEGSEFNGQLNVCMPKELTTACPEAAKHASVKCAGGYEEGDLIMHPKNRQLFYICFDGKFFETSCGEGNYYNAEEKSCMPDYEPKQSRSKRSVMKHEEHICPGGLQNFESVAHPLDCNRKLVCRDGRMIEESCERGYYFNEAVKACIKDVNNICPLSSRAASTTCVDGTFKVNDKDCTAYFRCCTNTWKEANCAEGEYFNPKKLQCEKDEKYYCLPPPVVPCVEGKQYQDPANCSAYFLCCSGELVSKSCETGYYFNGKECELDVNNQCWPKEVEPICVENAQKPGTNCSSYYRCCGNDWVEEFCDENYYYDEKKDKCLADTNNVCWPKVVEPNCVENAQKPGTNCSSYLRCCGNDWVEEFCDENYYYDEKKDKCLADTNNVCWPKVVEPNCVENEQKPGTNCSSYYRCCGNDWVEEFCDENYYYDEKKDKCLADTNNVCWPKVVEPNCVENEQKPGTNCSSYYRCCGNDWVEEFCDENYYYDEKKDKCLADTNNVCWPKVVEPNCVENAQKPGTNCSSYLRCCGNDWVEEFCDENYYYDEKKDKCLADTNNVCWPKVVEPNCVENEQKPGTNCSSYYRCCGNDWVEEFCDENYYYDEKKDKCLADTNNVCWPKVVEPNCVENEQKPGTNCSSYYRCCGNDWVEEFCDENYYYDEKKDKCLADTNNVCWPKVVEPNCVENEQKPGTNCSSYYRCCGNDWVEEFCDENYYYDEKKDKCLADTNNVCWPKVVEPNCVENAQKPGTNCSSYLRCCGNDWVEEFCDENYYYDEKKDKCLADTNNVCWPKVVEPNCVENEQKPGTNCSSYYRCCGNDWVEEFCDENYYYDEKKDKCLADTNNVCWPKVVEPNCVENEQKPGTNCSSYYRCCGNDWVEEFCDENYYYDEKKDKCLADTNNVCWPKVVEPNCVENAQKPGTNCSSYLRCCGNDWVEEFCDENYYYDEKKDKCLADTNNVCWPKVVEPNCVENEQKPGTNCSSYYRCCGNDWVEEFCDENYYYDEKKDKCLADTNNVCWPKVVEPNCVENEQKPGTNCSSYYRCCGNDWVEEFCDENYYYDEKKDKCLADTNNVCWPKVVEPNCVENEQKPGTNCSSYYRCCGNDWVEEFCDENYYYDEKKDKCLADTNNVCWPKVVEPNCVENEQKPGTNCSSYYRCCGNDWVEEFCDENYYYDEKKDKCLADTNNVCWPKVVEPNCVENEQKPGTNCSSYYRCCGNDWVEEFCDENYYYDEKKDKCLADTNNVCWPKVVEPNCVENEQKPGTNCSSYYRCCGNDWVEEFCDENYYYDEKKDKCLADTNNVCWPKVVEPNCVENEQKPGTNCSSYYRCCGNDWVEEFCDENYYYDEKKDKCLADTNNVCWPKVVEPNCVENEQKPGTNCSSYYRCCGNDWVEEFCDENYYYDEKKDKCLADTNNVCWPKVVEPNCVENEQKPGTNCSSYYRCCGNDWVEEFCDENYYYDEKKDKCLADTNNVCWPKVVEPNCVENEQKPGTNCSSYYRCCGNDWVEEFCDENYYYDEKKDKCLADTNNVCWPKVVEPNCVENAQKPGTNCSSYLRCCGNDWVEEFCDENYYYDEKKDKCLADTNNVCWPKVVEPNCVENEQKPGTNCSSYYRCCGNDWVEEFCDENYYYDEKKDKCLADTNNVCWPKVVEPNCVENAQKPGTNCSSYLRCCGNDWVEEFCDENYYYDEKKDKCLADTNNVCWPKVVEPNCVENEQKPGTNCSSYYRCCGNDWVEEFCDENYYYDEKKDKCLADTNNVCWPKDVETCSDGELRPDDDNCAAYYKCCSNGWVAEVCPDNEYFNWETEACEFDAEHECREAAPCKTGEKYADPENCSAYYECCGGVFKPQYCEAGYLYASAEAECVLDTKNECWTDEEDDNGCNTDCPGGYKNGTFVEGDDCDTFYICVNGELQLQSCGYGMYYNNVSRSCVADTDRTCWTNVCADEKNGVYLPVPKHCSMFYECMNGQSNALYCEEGDYFNPDTSACEPDLNAVCYNPCAEVDKVMTLPHPNCNQYYWCNDKTTLVGTCPLGGFNASLGSCDASTSCSNYKCNGVPNYVPFPDEKDKTLYYICINGVAVEKQCLPNQEFNGFACQYVSSPDCNATLCDTLQPYESFPTINGSETEFCMCIKGLAQKESCPTDYVFNETMKMCASNIPCNSMICKTNDNYYTFANNDDPATFCICINNVAVVADCPAKQTYNPYIDACTELVYSSDCDQTVCLKEDDSYTYAPKNESLNGICECKSNVGIFVECPPDTVFDSFLNICKLIDINCQSSKCVGAEDNTVFPALTTDEGYCQCQKGVAVYQNCLASESFNDTVLKCVPSLCDRSKCADQPPNVGYPATDNKYGFCMCDESGSSTFRPCPNDTEFSSVTNACKVPLQNCADTECVGVADNTKVPALSTVHGYCLCQGGKPTFEECLNNWVFDSVSQICEAPKVAIEDVCDMNYCNLPGNALKKYPSYSNIYGFCQCSAAGPSFEFCQAGYIFNEYSLVCVPSAESMCDIALCADATPESPYGIPAKTSNTAFCLCSGPDSIMVLNCADGKFFDKTLGYCVSKLEQGCGCPDGMKTGDRAPNAEDCTQYYECQSGSMQLKSCPAGQYFNTNTNCCLNNDGTCDANTACTCLGLYREGERIIHPHNMQLYFVCEKNNLHERNCGSGRIFNKAINQCMQATQAATFSKHFMRKRSADIEEVRTLKKVTNFFSRFLW
ncbi:uncharacterized protein LOC101900380 isoform X11 [Musca domestica]|uniref:Uncharacterized protein LOC101900380 isoform X11 n=1 Tax=Musca domestica TaxID=7370 RepID=A0ABM3VH67_MUSDO|nr:uncharacterized protein LOC101900380 isoform X11 [Musca domestica]